MSMILVEIAGSNTVFQAGLRESLEGDCICRARTNEGLKREDKRVNSL